MLSRALYRTAIGIASPKRVPHQVTSFLFQSQCHLRYASTVVKVPQMAESITEGTLKQFSKQVGDYVEADEEIATIETDKIDVAVNASEAGTITELLVEEEATVTVGQEIARLDTGGEKPAAKEEKEPEQKSEPEPKKEEKKEEKKDDTPPPAPKQEQPKEESKPAPSPPKQEKKPAPPPPPPSKKSEPSKDDGEKKFTLWSRDERRVKMNRMRLRIAERLKQAQNTTASLSTFQEVDMSSLIEFRSKYKDEYVKKTGIKIGFMGAFARACTLAMKDIPAVNAAIEGPNGGDTIVYHDYVDISVAVATEKGLTTPVVRNVESLNMLEVEKVISDLGRKARDNKLTIEDMAGGTFTISNGGVFGSLMSTPIINPPQAAVLGLHAIFNRCVPIDGKVEIRPMMNITLTYDHRLIDGREAATFLVKVKEYIQDPRRMLLG
ncbi:dihydrolipoyllysine-residue succinyltransferase [Microthyrium microscopicum]|uniref:dihydrolipoyllysine-residue succinyltransferase n=1 Tax=Microthyrium microscopicum TaxID=703497 RepID=A0A6A6U5J9_9PEZI|nr:dihydrolipoyllysine-residue succinyltransferase [Microthyrium microscopicum]